MGDVCHGVGRSTQFSSLLPEPHIHWSRMLGKDTTNHRHGPSFLNFCVRKTQGKQTTGKSWKGKAVTGKQFWRTLMGMEVERKVWGAGDFTTHRPFTNRPGLKKLSPFSSKSDLA